MRLDLAEEESPLAVLAPPVGEELAGRGGRVRVVLGAPAGDGPADLVDDLVRLLARRRAIRIQGELGAALFRLRDGDEELARAASVGDLAGDLAVGRRPEVARGLVEGRVEDRVLDQDRGHPRLCPLLRPSR
jgi:hypothetical protein